jgi:hypothetical protein
MVSYTTCFQNKIYVADKRPSSYQSAKSKDPDTRSMLMDKTIKTYEGKCFNVTFTKIFGMIQTIINIYNTKCKSTISVLAQMT